MYVRRSQRQPADWTVTVWLQTLSTLLDHVFLWVVSDGPHLNRAETDAMGISGQFISGFARLR